MSLRRSQPRAGHLTWKSILLTLGVLAASGAFAMSQHEAFFSPMCMSDDEFQRHLSGMAPEQASEVAAYRAANKPFLDLEDPMEFVRQLATENDRISFWMGTCAEIKVSSEYFERGCRSRTGQRLEPQRALDACAWLGDNFWD